MRPTRGRGSLAALLLLAAGTWAVAETPAEGPAQAQAPAQDAAARFEALQKRYEDTVQAFYDKVRDEKDEAAQMKLWEHQPGPEFVPEFKALALEAKGTDTAERAWLQVVGIAGEHGLQDDERTAIDALLADHIASPGLERLTFAYRSMGWRGQRDAGIAGLRHLAAASPVKLVQAAALFGLGSMLLEGAAPETAAAEKQEGRQVMQRIIQDYAGVKPKRGPAYSERAQGYLFEMDHLQVGMVAPDFEAVDENGKAFKISDYRGKVVVLDFWGFW